MVISPVSDGSVGGIQKLEHYCIAAWGTVKALAAGMGDDQLAKAMADAIKEGYRLDEELTQLAENRINPEAIRAGSDEDVGSEGKPSTSGSDGGGSAHSKKGSSGGTPRSGGSSDDLKSREYTGSDGQVHHHTREYMER